MARKREKTTGKLNAARKPAPAAKKDDYEFWRHENFFVMHEKSTGLTTICDLNQLTLIYHHGPFEDVFPMLDALAAARVNDRPIYPNDFDNLDPHEVTERGIEAMQALLDAPVSKTDEFEEEPVPPLLDIYAAAREDILDELIKPPKDNKS